MNFYHALTFILTLSFAKPVWLSVFCWSQKICSWGPNVQIFFRVCVCVCSYCTKYPCPSRWEDGSNNRSASLPLLHLSSKGQQLSAQPIPLFYLKRIAVLMCMLKHKISSAVFFSAPVLPSSFKICSLARPLSDESFCRRFSRRWTRSSCSPSKFRARKEGVSPLSSICCTQRSNSLFVWHLF